MVRVVAHTDEEIEMLVNFVFEGNRASEGSLFASSRLRVTKDFGNEYQLIGDGILVLVEEKGGMTIVVMIKLDALAEIALSLLSEIARFRFEREVGAARKRGERTKRHREGPPERNFSSWNPS